MNTQLGWFVIVGCCILNGMYADAEGFITDYNGGNVFSFDPSDLSTPATQVITGQSNTDCITVSPDGKTVYFTSFTDPGDVYSFPAAGPYVVTALGTGLSYLVGIAVSSDGSTGFAVASGGSGIYSFPLGGSYPHTATEVTPTGTTIPFPLILFIGGDTAYVGTEGNGIYTFPVNSATYTATQIQSSYEVTGLAVSGDGFLYFSVEPGQLYRVPAASPADTPVLVASTSSSTLDGITLSPDNSTIYGVSLNADGVYSCSTDPSGYPYTFTLNTGLDLPDNPIDIIIRSISTPSSVSPPTSLVGHRPVNRLPFQKQFFNRLTWEASVSNDVVAYNIDKNGTFTASVPADAPLRYNDYSINKKESYIYTVTAVTSSGAESSSVGVSIDSSGHSTNITTN